MKCTYSKTNIIAQSNRNGSWRFKSGPRIGFNFGYEATKTLRYPNGISTIDGRNSARCKDKVEAILRFAVRLCAPAD